MNLQRHWNQIYQTKKSQEVSWYQHNPDLSLTFITESGVNKDAGVIDVGGGTSVLIDCLCEAGYTRLAILDLSSVALSHSRTRLGARAAAVEWFEADVTSFKPPHRFGLWHDRAVFHFLTAAADRCAYIETLQKTLLPAGSVIIATFSLDGPAKCSGLNVVRYDEKSIMAELGPGFQLEKVQHETHLTPWQSKQSFSYFRFKWKENA